MLGTTEWLHNLWLLEWYSAPQCEMLWWFDVMVFVLVVV
jgi:hypothetical protein